MKTTKIIFALTLIIVLAVSLVVAGCGGGEETAVDDEKVLKVGILGPFTGHNARIGEEFKGAVEMAFARVDNKIGDYNVEFVWIDSQSDPEKATRAYEEAVIRDNIDVGLLNWHSSVAVACMDVAARNQIPHFFTLGATEVVNEKYESDPEFYSYWLKGWATPYKLSGAYVEALMEAQEKGLWEPRNNRVAVYGEDTDWGRSYGASFKSDFESIGWEVVGEEYFTPGETELVPLLYSLRDMDASVIVGSMGSPPSWAAFIKQAQEVGVQSVIIADGLGWVGEWYEMTGESSNYVLDQIPAWTTAEALQFRDDFEEQYGITPSTSGAALPYDYVCFFIEIAQKTLEEYGELNKETIYQYGQEKVWTGEHTYADGIIMEDYSFNAESVPDPVVGQGHFIFPVIQYFEGEGKIMWPDVWKEADFMSPAYIN